jgi:large subunit ribosomal protein L49
MIYNPPTPTILSTINPLDPQSPPPSAAQPTGTPTPAAATEAPYKLPYLITRTPSAHLPIYEHTKGGGTKHITVLRKLTGDLDALQLHLREALGLAQGFIDAKGRKKEHIVVNRTTQQVVIRGWRGAEVKKWCELAGF